MPNNRIDQIKQALVAAENSIRIAKQLLAEGDAKTPALVVNKSQEPERSGTIGIYDGEKLVTTTGEVFPVPGNYASKSLLVVGDTLKMFEENGEKRFKQIEHVKRHKTTGLLVKKEGKFRAITPEGSYKVLIESINHFNGEVGDEVILHLPAGNLTSPFAAIETVHKKSKSTETDSVEEEKKPEPVTKPIVVNKPAPVATPKPEMDKKPKSPAPAKEEVKPAPKKIDSEVVKVAPKAEVKEDKPKEEVKEPEKVEEPVINSSGEEELS